MNWAIICVLLSSIHYKSLIRWNPESADNLEFSAERLSENAKILTLQYVRNKGEGAFSKTKV